MCLYVNTRWFKTVVVHETVCSLDIELFTGYLRPFYLPRYFLQLFIMVAYIHPKELVDIATSASMRVVQRLQSKSPEAPNLITEDFNHCSEEKFLCLFFFSTLPAL